MSGPFQLTADLHQEKSQLYPLYRTLGKVSSTHKWRQSI